MRDFELPKSWAEDREIHFVLEGVRSCCFLWVNGSLVGYSQGSGLPSEFVITPWLGSGKNRIAVAVFAWCDGSYLESYGAPWGLVRDVYVLARHKGHVRDVWIRAEKGMGEMCIRDSLKVFGYEGLLEKSHAQLMDCLLYTSRCV